MLNGLGQLRASLPRGSPLAGGLAFVLAIALLAGCSAATSSAGTPPLASPPASIAAPIPAAPPIQAPTAPPQAADATPGTNAADWTTYHRDNARSGYLPEMQAPQTLSIAWKASLDGAVYAEPLVIGGHIIAATENNSLYSLNAATGQVEWRTNLGEPVPLSSLPCGNIDPLGITGTPVYDPATGLIFAVAEVEGPAHILVGVDARTGAVRLRRSADIQGMEPAPHQQRAALALSQGMVYIAYGGLFGDCGNYKGRVVASRTDGQGPLLSFTVPTLREGGIWAPPGPAIDASGRLYVSVGNGAEMFGSWDHSDSVLRLSPTLELEDGFAPAQWRQDNARDADLGSLGPVLLPNGLVFIAGKAGIGYLLHAGALGGVGGQAAELQVCHAYGGAAVVGSTIYVPCNEGVQQVRVGPGATFQLGWQASGIPGSPVVGGHTLYSMDRNGTLHALDAATGRERAALDVGSASRFATPTLFQDTVFVPTLSGVVAVKIR